MPAESILPEVEPTLLEVEPATPPPASTVPQRKPQRKKKRRFWRIIIALVVLGAVGGGLWYWLEETDGWGRYFTKTHQAFYPSPDETDLNLAETGVAANSEWTPVLRSFSGVEMVLVPAGCFEMGSNEGDSDEEPVHEVCFNEPYWIDVYEVTNEQYGSSGRFNGQDRPREQVDWYDALSHCQSRGARLPTEAEWEYAARGPDSLVYPWGNTFERDYVVHGQSSHYQTANVGSKPEGTSWVGAYDLSGNVWEWVNDWYDGGYYASLSDGVVNPQGPESGDYRVLRGGSWGDLNDLSRAADRGGGYPDSSDFNRGFRCARSYSP